MEDCYKKKYEDALERARIWKEKSGMPIDKQGILDNIFPELQGSKKIKPMFNVGEWVVNKFGDSWHIDSFDNKNYQVSDGKGHYNYFPIAKQDEMHHWTIEDAKDGDILCSYFDNPFIYNGNHGGDFIGAYCGISTSQFVVAKEPCSWTYAYDSKPATKKQCDLLFQKMKEAGYEQNPVTKQLERKEVTKKSERGKDDEDYEVIKLIRIAIMSCPSMDGKDREKVNKWISFKS